MKLSAVGNTQAILFEPENKREAKLLNNYMTNKEFMETPKAKANIGVSLGTLGLSYLGLAMSTFAKKPSAKIAGLVAGCAGLLTSIIFTVKHAIDRKNFRLAELEKQAQGAQEKALQEQKTSLEATHA